MHDLQFIETNNGEHILVVSGDVGIVLYKWSQFEESISAAMDENDGTSIPKPKKVKCQDPVLSTRYNNITPITTFKPHTSTTFGSCVEINSTSYDKSNGILYGAAGDVFGCYQYDIATEKLLGTFGGASGGRSSVSHTDYLHVVKTIPESNGMGSRYVMTGGEDGNLGFWDGKERKLIEMMNIPSAMNKNKHLVTSDTTYRGFSSSTSWNNNAPNSNNMWVSSMDTNGNWLAVCGGSENNSSRSGTNSSGFMTLWHLPTRTFTSGRATRESINTVVYNHSLDSFVTGGNEGRVSFWESTSVERSSRSWSTAPATYSLSVDPDSSSMIVGGTGGILDCFVDRVKTSQLCI